MNNNEDENILNRLRHRRFEDDFTNKLEEYEIINRSQCIKIDFLENKIISLENDNENLSCNLSLISTSRDNNFNTLINTFQALESLKEENLKEKHNLVLMEMVFKRQLQENNNKFNNFMLLNNENNKELINNILELDNELQNKITENLMLKEQLKFSNMCNETNANDKEIELNIEIKYLRSLVDKYERICNNNA
jgi:hypothetical protein